MKKFIIRKTNYQVTKKDNNTCLVAKFLEWGPSLNQMFLMDAISKYATRVIESEHEVRVLMRDSMIHPDAWIQCAKDWISCLEIRDGEEIKIKKDELLPDEMRKRLLIAALEEESCYWYYLNDAHIAYKYQNDGMKLFEAIFIAIMAGEKFPVNEVGDISNVLGYVTLETIRKGEALLKHDFPQIWDGIVNNHFETFVADIWFQFCVLGKIKYGYEILPADNTQ